MPTNDRPDPDTLLEGIKKTEDRKARGKLKIFFGMCPGVGKTFAMLEAAQEKKRLGVNVVIGFIETHKRADTEKLTQGLPEIPRRKVEHRGTLFEEFDLDQTLILKPALVLVDELAHTNAPGSKHPKRYQDVQELLVAGIDVFTTMNVQHVESRSDLVYQIAGVPVKEKVPDAFLEFADQIELIDLAPEELLRRLKDGKVYQGERADRAAENFFQEEKLIALRELALRFTAEVVDDQLREHMQAKRILGPWNTNERLMVAVSHSPLSPRLIRATRRMAFNLESPWVALSVDTGAELSREEHERLTKNLNLARELGAEVVTTQDQSVASALTRVAADRNVTQIVMGRPDRRFFRDLFRGGNILDQLVNETSEVDIHVIRQKRRPVYRGFQPRLPKLNSKPLRYLYTLGYLALLSLVGYLIVEIAGYRAVGFGFLLGILPVATFMGLGPTLMAAFLSALIWDFFFIPPRFTIAVNEPEDGMMILAYFAVASVAGLLTSRIKHQARDLIQRESRANILYSFGRKLSEAKTDQELATHAASSIEAIFPCAGVVLKADINGKLGPTPLYGASHPLTEKDLAVAAWAFANRKKAGWKTDTLSSSPCLCLPILGRSEPTGMLVIFPKTDRSLSLEQENLIETILGHLALALERSNLEVVSRRNEIYERSEKLHQALLNTVSHELRTPLTSIIGSASLIPKNQFVDEIVHSAERLNRTIENLMDMSRISSGVLKLDEHLFELNDFLQSVTQKSENLALRHTLKLELAADDLFVKGDEKILEHIIQNLISNATQYSPNQSTILIRTRRNQSFAEFTISDEGKGLPEEDIEKIFDRFYRPAGSRPGGIGLGLSITKAIVEAHGGAVFAANRTDRTGAVFTVILPLRDIPSEILR